MGTLALVLLLGGGGGGWSDMVIVQTPKDYVVWQDEGVCQISVKGVSALWEEHRALALDPDSQGQSSAVAEVRFNSQPINIPRGNGWFHYYGDCQPQGMQQCTPREEPVVRDSTWCVVLGASFADQSMLLACVGAPNGLEGGTGEWLGVCEASGEHVLSSLMTLVYVDPSGSRSYRSALIPAVPLDTWVTVQVGAAASSGALHASMSVGTAEESYPPLDAEFTGARLNPAGLAGVQPGTMPQTVCTGYYGRPVRSMARKCAQ